MVSCDFKSTKSPFVPFRADHSYTHAYDFASSFDSLQIPVQCTASTSVLNPLPVFRRFLLGGADNKASSSRISHKMPLKLAHAPALLRATMHCDRLAKQSTLRKLNKCSGPLKSSGCQSRHQPGHGKLCLRGRMARGHVGAAPASR